MGSMPSASGGIARLVYARLLENGIPAAPLLSKAGLSVEQIDDRSVRLRVRSQIRFLQLGADALDGRFGPVGQAIEHGSNLALRRRVWDAVRAEVHRHDPEVHDDLDLSFHVGERHVIRYRTGLGMRIAMRPFDDLASFAVRFSRGFRSVLVHWPRDFPPARWLRLASRSRQRPESTRMPRPRSLRI